MKFDLIISNPPYNQNLDLKILKNIYNLGDKICFVHPARWLLNQKPSNNIVYKIKDIFNDGYNYFEILNAYKYFPGVQINEGISISYFDKTKDHYIKINDTLGTMEVYTVDNLYDVSKYGASNTYKLIKEKILRYCTNKNNLLNMQDVNNNLEFKVSFSGIQSYTAILAKYPEKNEYHIKYYFSSKKEKHNFETFLKTKIIRFCVSIYKTGKQLGSGELASVPYMPTYEHPWTDEEVATELGLTQEELAWAINWIPDYYPEDKEKYAKYKK